MVKNQIKTPSPVSHYKLRLVYSFFALISPVWIPLLCIILPFSIPRNLHGDAVEFVLFWMLLLPLTPIALWSGQRLINYVVILIGAIPFLVAAGSLLVWMASMAHFGP